MDDTPSKPDPFGKPEPPFIVKEVPGYVLQLNKFCAIRPQLLLHPKTFVPQTDRLTCADFEASLLVLEEFEEDERHVFAFYNCGPEAGSSQPYKHMQIMFKPSPSEFSMWPDRCELSSDCGAPPPILSVPYLSHVASISGHDASAVYDRYARILADLEHVLDCAVTAHNVVYTRKWLCVIPRRESGPGSKPSCNSMGMLGMIWTVSQEERQSWDSFGLADYLSVAGFPPSMGSA